MKYGVILPQNIEEAYALDKINGNDFWDKSIKKELGNALIAFKLLEDGELIPENSVSYNI